jgi:hypothetical protein
MQICIFNRTRPCDPVFSLNPDYIGTVLRSKKAIAVGIGDINGGSFQLIDSAGCSRLSVRVAEVPLGERSLIVTFDCRERVMYRISASLVVEVCFSTFAVVSCRACEVHGKRVKDSMNDKNKSMPVKDECRLFMKTLLKRDDMILFSLYELCRTGLFVSGNVKMTHPGN